MSDVLKTKDAGPGLLRHPAWPAVVADGIGLLLLIGVAPLFRAEFVLRTIRGGMWMLIIYGIFAFGVNGLKRLVRQNQERAPRFGFDLTRQQPLLFILGIITVLAFVWAEIDLNQATESMIELMSRPESYGHEGEITLYYSFGPVFLWLMVGVLYLASFALPTSREIEPNTSRYARAELIGLIGINVMLITTAAYVATLIVRAGGGIGWGLLGIFALVFFFLPPRLHHMMRHPRRESTVSFLILLIAASIFLFL